MSDAPVRRRFGKARPDGSQPTQLTKAGGYQAFESLDGKLVFYAKERSRPGIRSVPVGGGPEVPVLQAAQHNAWAVAEGGIYYIDYDHADSSTVPVNRFDFGDRQDGEGREVAGARRQRGAGARGEARWPVGSHGPPWSIGAPA